MGSIGKWGQKPKLWGRLIDRTGLNRAPWPPGAVTARHLGVAGPAAGAWRSGPAAGPLLVQDAERQSEFLSEDVELMNAQQDLPRLQDLATLFVVGAMLGEMMAIPADPAEPGSAARTEYDLSSSSRDQGRIVADL